MADQIITGIDIGSSKLAVVVAHISDEEEQPRVMGFASVPSAGVKRGQIVDIQRVTDVLEQAVEQAERMAGSKIDHAIVSVGGPHIESLNSNGVVAVTNPHAEIHADDVTRVIDAANAISLSSTRQVVDVLPREYVVDGQGGIKNPTGMTGVRLEVNTHIITASQTTLKNIERALSDLGIAVDGFVFSGLASSLSTLTETERELGVALVDVGGGKIDTCIFADGALSYSCSIPVGARHVTNDIAVGLRVSLESAEKIKLFLSKQSIKTDHDGKPKDETDISELHLPEGLTTLSSKTVVDGIIRPRMEEMFSGVLEHIDKSGYGTQIPSGLVITGGGALTVSALESARRVLGMPARIGSPDYITGLVDEVMYPQYATLTGLLISAKQQGERSSRSGMKDFDSLLRGFTPKISFKKITDMVKSFMP